MISYKYEQDLDFNYLLQQLDNPAPFLRAFAAYRNSEFNQHIALGLDYYDEPFSPLSPNYYRQKLKTGRAPILVRSGAMKRSHQVSVKGKELIETLALPAPYHQSGTSRMPQRLLLPDDRGLNAKDQEKLLELATKYLQQSIRGGKQ